MACHIAKSNDHGDIYIFTDMERYLQKKLYLSMYGVLPFYKKLCT